MDSPNPTVGAWGLAERSEVVGESCCPSIGLASLTLLVAPKPRKTIFCWSGPFIPLVCLTPGQELTGDWWFGCGLSEVMVAWKASQPLRKATRSTSRGRPRAVILAPQSLYRAP